MATSPWNTVALVAARGGSKHPWRKNLLPIDGVPLVARVLRTARGAAPELPIVITTDDEEIKEVARAEQAIVIDRPAELATDTSNIKDALRHACRTMMEDWNWPIERVLFFEGNTLIVNPAIISRALELFRPDEADGLTPILEVNLRHPSLCVQRDSQTGILTLPLLDAVPGNRQERAEPLWHLWTGPCCFAPRNVQRPGGGAWSYFGERVIGMPIGEYDIVHVDSAEDVLIAELLCRHRGVDGRLCDPSRG